MSTYEDSSLTEISAALDGLEEATPAEVFEAARPYSAKALAAVAASKADAAGGATVISCLLARDANLDIHDVGNHEILWDALYDNPWDWNTLLAIPDGLGLSFAFDGTADDVTTTEDGVWAFTLQIATAGDQDWRGGMNAGPQQTGLAFAFGEKQQIITQVVPLSSGSTVPWRIATSTQATADPFNATAYLTIVRLA